MRGKKAQIRAVKPDQVYQSEAVARLIGYVMKDGKKSVAQKEVYEAFSQAGKNLKEKPMVVFEKALANVYPQMEVRSRRVGGAAYQIPMPVSRRRQTSLALRWLVEGARSRPNKEFHTFSEKLAAEIIDAYNKTGGAVKRREEMEKVAEANKAFSHFRW